MQDDSTVYLQFNFAKFRPLPNLPATAPKFTLYVEVNFFFFTRTDVLACFICLNRTIKL